GDLQGLVELAGEGRRGRGLAVQRGGGFLERVDARGELADALAQALLGLELGLELDRAGAQAALELLDADLEADGVHRVRLRGRGDGLRDVDAGLRFLGVHVPSPCAGGRAPRSAPSSVRAARGARRPSRPRAWRARPRTARA